MKIVVKYFNILFRYIFTVFETMIGKSGEQITQENFKNVYSTCLLANIPISVACTTFENKNTEEIQKLSL